MVAKSYSAYQSHKKCGAQYKYRYVDRIPAAQIESPAATRGTDKHAAVEALIHGEVNQLPSDIRMYEDFFNSMKKHPVCEPEKKLGFDVDWNVCDWDKAYVRMVLDLRVVSERGQHVIYELKTGKMYDDHAEQRHLYGLSELVSSDTPEVRVYGVYLDLQEMKFTDYGREQLPFMKNIWEDKFSRMDNESSWIPNPGYYCRWCAYARTNKGPCEFG